MNGTIGRYFGIACCSFAFASFTGATELTLPRDGWVSWEVSTVDDAPAWCCFGDDRPSAANTTACRLDDKQFNYGSRDGATTDSLRIYARFTGGTLERLRALASSCPIRTDGPVQMLPNAPEEASARWLAGMLSSRDKIAARSLRTDLIAALALHRWLAQSAAPATERAIDTALTRETEPRVRDQAIFALAQLPDERAANALIAIAENRSLPRDDRKQAIFWLAQENSATAIAYLDKVMMHVSR